MGERAPERCHADGLFAAGLTLEIRIDDELIELLDRGMDAHPKTCPSRPAAVRHALRQWLIGQGVLPPHDRR
jgi:hypothetical protein